MGAGNFVEILLCQISSGAMFFGELVEVHTGDLDSHSRVLCTIACRPLVRLIKLVHGFRDLSVHCHE